MSSFAISWQDEGDQQVQDPAHADDPAHTDDPAHAEDSLHVDGEHVEVDLSTIEGRMDYYLDSDHLIHHVQDVPYLEFPTGNFADTFKVGLPNPLGYTDEMPLVPAPQGASDFVGPTTFQPTKFVALQVIAALVVCAVMIPYARRVRDGQRPRGKFWNMIDAVVCYVRNEVATPAIGASEVKRFLPLLWTIFFFVLTLNLMGMFPLFGAATGSISVTAAYALVVFGTVVLTGTQKMGVVGFWKAQCPHMDLPGGLKYVLVPMIWLIEVFGLFVKHVVLAVRLFANMFAGHLVVAVFVAFIGVAGWTAAAYGAVPVVIGASVAVNLLELLVAFIQAYVFTFLSALFIGAAVHPH